MLPLRHSSPTKVEQPVRTPDANSPHRVENTIRSLQRQNRMTDRSELRLYRRDYAFRRYPHACKRGRGGSEPSREDCKASKARRRGRTLPAADRDRTRPDSSGRRSPPPVGRALSPDAAARNRWSAQSPIAESTPPVPLAKSDRRARRAPGACAAMRRHSSAWFAAPSMSTG